MSAVPLTKMVPILIATCPDDGCNAVLIFPSKDKIVDCHGCGQRHKASDVKDIRQMQEQALGVKNVLRSLLLATNANMKKSADLVSFTSVMERQYSWLQNLKKIIQIIYPSYDLM
jgi:hypothetical protein